MTRDVLPDASWPADGTPVVIDGVTYTSQCFSAMNAWNTRNETVHPGSRPRSLPTSGFPNGRTLLKYLQDRANPAFSGNTADIAAGLTPREFRQNSDGSFDSLHPNLAGHVVIADFYEEALQTQVLPSPITASTVFTLTASGTIVNQVGFDTSSAVTTDSAVSPVTPGFTLPVVDQEARDDIEAIEAASPVGPLTSGVWRSTTGLPRLRLTGTGTVAIDARDSLGTVTADVVGPYTLTGETNRIEFPFFGSTTIEIRATITGSATAEII
jgi:hypothetical protein